MGGGLHKEIRYSGVCTSYLSLRAICLVKQGNRRNNIQMGFFCNVTKNVLKIIPNDSNTLKSHSVACSGRESQREDGSRTA